MLIKTKGRFHLTEQHSTPEPVYRQRRQILQALGLGAAALGTAAIATPSRAGLLDALFGSEEVDVRVRYGDVPLQTASTLDTVEKLPRTPEIKAITYNNFYEFGTDKSDPAENSMDFQVKPWTLEIGGEVEKPQTVDVWELINSAQLEERIYRMRCVEAWSMVIPWIGIELNKLIKQVKPTSRAKYVAFRTLYDPEQMPGQASRFGGGGLNYPYREGLRIDEAMHPLTLMTVGMYGKSLPPQNGAPLRLIVPWKYGFKGIKSIVRMDLVEEMPPTTWSQLAPGEYGFYANVNPAVDHPRWSQSSERFIGESRLGDRIPTLPFNGYAEQVAQLYDGMNLKKWY